MSKLSYYDDCPACGTIFSPAEEVCRYCGFDPVSDPEHARLYEDHLDKKLNQFNQEQE